MLKRITLSALLIMLMGLVMVACSPAADEPSAPADTAETDDPVVGDADDCSSPDVFCVGLVTDVGSVDDRSFNQSAWEGALQAQTALGARVSFIETSDARDYQANIALFAEDGFDVIVTVGFALGEATIEAAAMYPDIMFIGVDQFQVETIPNVAGLIFPEDIAGFLGGALGGMLTESNIIAAVLGTDLVPPVVAFKEGFENGARFVNPDIQIISTFHPGGLDVAFTDPEWGASTAAQAIGLGADFVFGAGGNTGNGALVEVAGYDGVYCLGVDTDQWFTVPAAQPCLVSSAMKLITPGVFELIEAAQDGNFPGGNYVGEVGLAPFHDFEDQISDEVKERLAEIDAGLRDGSIPTGYNP